MIVDTHTHTHYSYDCFMKTHKILSLAKSRGLDAIVINDHDTIKGGLEAKSINPYPDLEVIVGAEIKTNIGDITGIFLTEEIQSRNYSEVIKEIKNQGGITILNHPYEGHKLDEMNFKGIDLIEGYNSRVSLEKNQKAVALAQELNKPIIAGSDSHRYSDIARCTTVIENNDWLDPKELSFKPNAFFSTLISQYIKAYKKRDVSLLLNRMLYTPKYIYKKINA